MLDGDSLLLRIANREQEVRLFGIDAPEFTQPHGKTARAALRRMLADSDLAVMVKDVDRYDRQVVILTHSGQAEPVNLALVAAGHAWVYERYNREAAYLAAQDRARAQRRGLWARPDPVPPWEWRRKR